MIEAAAAGFLLLLVVVALEADDAIHGIAEFFSGAKKSPFLAKCHHLKKKRTGKPRCELS